MPEYEILAINIKKIRHLIGETQIEFAENCGISVEELSLVERGKADVKLSTIQKLAAYSGVSVSDLLTRRDEYAV